MKRVNDWELGPFGLTLAVLYIVVVYTFKGTGYGK